MRNLESYVLRAMGREGKHTFKDYRDYFYKGTDAKGKSILPRNLFGLSDAKMPKPSRRGEQNLDGGIELLPFDRSIWASASVDRLSLSEPHKSHTRSEEMFEDLWSKHVDIDNNTNNAVEKIVQTLQKDANLGCKIELKDSRVLEMVLTKEYCQTKQLLMKYRKLFKGN